ncbi:hypothetical protein FZI85_17350 [Mycobacterium sp. CBMA293]|uniref:hypothetical protein n=1 Tax=unclassified Mycolicibacterium TaxID=2636767 RepID=UPI0012DED63B|nr:MULTISPECIES: hypothetical protein [unclassified Mycolicibacterium]MUL44489.1 hypothetical protein [Mycolicibacterium sp. CBMA 360]MUL59809.1 hypothetical protein [Mycolicibacterium sp. CBMA 335]MUL68652.1 hypothetical protein [Mycolicibacterium sp. CBMA 311]MUL93957.1 hypothetical protein [Mycolicibacterium sp. CBMA 230]MUM06203.1 hypothetical protein [Mycolicibacterium sp. CBMA 213]
MTEVFDEPNRRHGHLLITDDGQDYVFTNYGQVVTFGHFAGPSHELSPEQLRVIGDYCHRQANRLDSALEAPSTPNSDTPPHCVFEQKDQ